MYRQPLTLAAAGRAGAIYNASWDGFDAGEDEAEDEAAEVAEAAAGDVAGARPDPTCGPPTWEHPSPNPSPASPRRGRRGSDPALMMHLAVI